MKAPDFTLEEVKEYLHSEVHYIEAVGHFKNAILYHIEKLEAERDAAVKSLRGRCFECKHNKTSVCLICSKDKELKYWQWRGVQKEE